MSKMIIPCSPLGLYVWIGMELIALRSIDQFIKEIERDADFCLLGGRNPFFMSAEELDKMMRK
jgi:hypothetical protein